MRSRLEHDAREGHHPAADRSFGSYPRLRAAAEPIEGPKLVLATCERPLAELVEAAPASVRGV